MEFEDEHEGEEEEEEEEEEDEDEEDHITIPPPSGPPPQAPATTAVPPPQASSYEPPVRAGRVAMDRGRGVRYRECLKNHAVSIGGHAVDGCGEFMPAGEEGSLDALKCAACSCHRNFHRKEAAVAVAEAPSTWQPPYYQQPQQQQQRAAVYQQLQRPSSSGEMMDDVSNPSSSGGGGGGGGGMAMKKRFRTKFTQEQKDKMLEFAEKVGWRIQKHDEAAVQQFCSEVHVRRQVLKVWMHNNKHTLGKKP